MYIICALLILIYNNINVTILQDIPYFTTGNTRNENMLTAGSAGNHTQGQQNSENTQSILVVTGVCVFLVAVAVIAMTLGVIHLRKRSSEVKLERVQLLSDKSKLVF